MKQTVLILLGAMAMGASLGVAADGKAVFQAKCAACHTTGVAGAPKLGDKAAWAPRIKAGKDALVQSAIKGKNAMPPRAGSNVSDADINAAVEYMIDAAK